MTQANNGAPAGLAACAVVPVVLMVTVTDELFAPGVTDVGLMVQVAKVGTPAQAKLTALEKLPPTDPTDNWYVAVDPAFTVAVPPVEGMLKSMPDPESETSCGLLAAEFVNVSVPVRLPEAVGVKVT